MTSATSPSSSRQQLKSLLSGGVGGACLVLAGQPFDLVKTRIQTAAHVPGIKSLSAVGVARDIIKTQGLRGLYRGMSAPLAGVTPIFAICFWAYELGKTTIRTHRGLPADAQLTLTDVGIAGAASALPTTLIMGPGERIKVILQTQKGFSGPLDVLKHLLKTGGVASVFRGSGATFLRDSTGSFAYFAAYEAVKRSFTPEGSTGLSPLAIVLGGGAAGVANWLVALPFDTIKSRLQAHVVTAGAIDAPAPSMASVARHLVATEGFAGLYRGIAPALARALPANGACFLGMEAAKSVLDTLM